VRVFDAVTDFPVVVAVKLKVEFAGATDAEASAANDPPTEYDSVPDELHVDVAKRCTDPSQLFPDAFAWSVTLPPGAKTFEFQTTIPVPANTVVEVATVVVAMNGIALSLLLSYAAI
jgi:hypothetical protein